MEEAGVSPLVTWLQGRCSEPCTILPCKSGSVLKKRVGVILLVFTGIFPHTRALAPLLTNTHTHKNLPSGAVEDRAPGIIPEGHFWGVWTLGGHQDRHSQATAAPGSLLPSRQADQGHEQEPENRGWGLAFLSGVWSHSPRLGQPGLPSVRSGFPSSRRRSKNHPSLHYSVV